MSGRRHKMLSQRLWGEAEHHDARLPLAVLATVAVSVNRTPNPDWTSPPCLAFLKRQHCLPFNLQPSTDSINILATPLSAAALLGGPVGSTWQINDNYYITPLKFRLSGMRDQSSLISLPPANALMSVFHSEAQTACSTVTLHFVSGPTLLGNSSHGSPQSIPT